MGSTGNIDCAMKVNENNIQPENCEYFSPNLRCLEMNDQVKELQTILRDK